MPDVNLKIYANIEFVDIVKKQTNRRSDIICVEITKNMTIDTNKKHAIIYECIVYKFSGFRVNTLPMENNI